MRLLYSLMFLFVEERERDKKPSIFALLVWIAPSLRTLQDGDKEPAEQRDL